MLPDSIKKFIELFSALPSIGPRQATRLAFYLIQQGRGKINEFAKSLIELGDLKNCPDCFFPYSDPKSASRLCPICGNPKRNKSIIAIVEKETDLISLEKTKKFNGRYLIIGDLKKTGILESNQKLRLNHLKNFIKKQLAGQAEEIILALNPTTYGDLNANLITQELKGFTKKISRLGRGIPTGGEIEFADEETLEQAIEKRS